MTYHNGFPMALFFQSLVYVLLAFAIAVCVINIERQGRQIAYLTEERAVLAEQVDQLEHRVFIDPADH